MLGSPHAEKRTTRPLSPAPESCSSTPIPSSSAVPHGPNERPRLNGCYEFSEECAAHSLSPRPAQGGGGAEGARRLRGERGRSKMKTPSRRFAATLSRK